MNTVLTTKYPLDFESLFKGQYITAGELEKITGKQADTDEYRFALLALQARIQKETTFTVKICNGAELKILTDEEASRHNHALFVQALRSTHRRFELNTSVDVGELSNEQRVKHERNLVVQGQYIQAIRQTRKAISVAAHKRALPSKTSTDEPIYGEAG